MKRIQLSLCLFGIVSLANRAAGRLKGEQIRGGTDAKEGQFPYQISIQAYDQNMCGGSILTESFVITAAHCFINKNGSFMDYPYKVVGGISDLNSENKTNRIVVDVKEVFVLKEYHPKQSRFERSTADIAMLKLNKNLDIDGNPNLAKIKLPEKEETYAGKRAIVSGFGDNEIEVVENPETGEREEKNGWGYGKMRFAEADVLSHADCQNYYTDVKVTEKHICAAIVQRKDDQPEGVCDGDSGGPLVYNGTQIGVVSGSPRGCREDSKPAVYTRVSNYLDFINKVVNGTIDDSIISSTLNIEDWM